MEAVMEKPEQNVEAAREMKLQDPDLVHELSHRLDNLCRYAQCIANAEGNEDVQRTWHDLEHEELDKIRELKELIAARIEQGVFLDDL
jgi:hypothetical protein